MSFDYSKLRGRIRELCGTQSKFAQKLGLSSTSLSNKLNNSVEFTQSEIDNACVILKIDRKDIPEYFFVLEVQKTKQNTTM